VIFNCLYIDTKFIAEVLISYGTILRGYGEVTAAQGTLVDAPQLALRIGPRLMVVAALEALSRVIITEADADLTIRLAPQTLRRDLPYEQLKITGMRGLTEVEKATMCA
jgi:hypothetical protein